MSQKPLSILISGAGVAGSTLALTLARNPSFNPKPIITLIERSPTPRLTGQAVDIRGLGVDVIRKLDLEQKIKERHTTEVGIGIINPKGETIATFSASGDAKKQAGTSEYEILRGELARLLLEEVEDAREKEGANVNIVYGESISSLKDEDDGVAVEFSHGKLEAQKFDVVLAADGIMSTTRTMMFDEYKDMEASGYIKPVGWYLAYFTIPREEHDEDLWKWFHAPGGLCVHMRPHRNKTTMGVYLSIVYPKKESIPEMEELLTKGTEKQMEHLRARFKDVGWQIDRFLKGMDQADDFYMNQWAQVVLPKWTKGRCGLIGDTAHATMGIGTSYAMLGAYLVAGELAKVKSNDSKEIAAALGRYEELLQPMVQKHQNAMPRALPQLANPQTAWGIAALQTVVKLVYLTSFHKLLTGLGESEDQFELPDYGYKATV
jgi:2-polyprenyl-6-methoxyphenol hydroxylase-like FAD-dependent oxidoreductase